MSRNGRLAAMWRIDLMSFGLVALAVFLTSLTHGGDGTQPAPTAVSLMEEAHNGRVVWKDFPGFRAKIRAAADGKAVEGTVTVSSKGTISLELPSGEGFAWVETSLKSLVGHRLSDDGAITTVAFADDVTSHPLGRLLKSTDESDKSLWRVQGDLLTEVHRFNGKTRFVISVADVARNAEGKHLPKNFSVTTWDSVTGQIKTSRQVYNEWARVGHLDLPAKLLAATSKDDGSRRVEQLELSGHELLSTTANAAP
ncbi:DUF3386 family protein [Schlesneria sp. T3-172]|uniref:DUF3386 family protein n=1 Tax=Schlesneria sphaerica TaxID=3373610 RepID=UPI0037CB1643